jgi:hypothetical protein
MGMGGIVMRAIAVGLGMLLLAGCTGPSPRQQTVGLLQHRLHMRMADAVRAGVATVQDRPDGAVVVIADRSHVTGIDPHTDMIEALIEPALLRAAIVPPAYGSAGRMQAWQADFDRLGVRSAQVMPPPAQNGVTVALLVVCPHYGNLTWGYTNGERRPSCY